jgi:outer membrane protein insertion porin family
MRRFSVSFATLVVFVMMINTCLAQEEGIVNSIEIRGNKVTSQALIVSRIKTRVGQPFSQAIARDDIKRLFALGFFLDVRMDLEEEASGIKVIFYVQEKPILKRLSFEGVRYIKREELIGKIKSKLDEFLSPTQLKEDLREIENLYRQKGFAKVEVTHTLDVDPQTNEAKLKILIKEGRRFRIRKISFEGNRVFRDKRLLKLIKTRPDTLFTSGLFKEEVLEEDIERIKRFYRKEGFVDIEADYEVSYQPKRGEIFIEIDIHEGKRYLVGAIDIKGARAISKEEILESIEMPSGDTFSQEKLSRDKSIIEGLYFEQGYIFAKVEPSTSLNPETGRVDIIYSIIENEIAYVDKIDIRGNIKTKDVVIRRELRIFPGDPFKGEKLRRSRERLNNLGFFEEVSFDVEPGTATDRRDLVVNVKEAKTGEFSFGAGYSTIDKFVGFVEIAQRNFDFKNFPTFTGDGQDLRLRTEFGTVTRDYELSFTEPWIFDYPLSFGFDVYQKTRLRESAIGWGFDETRRGGDIRLGKELTEYLRADFSYRLEDIEISDVPTEASNDLKKEEGENRISGIALKLTNDTRDNRFSPSRGYVASGLTEFAGSILGGDKDFAKFTGSLAGYKAVFDKFLLEGRLRVGLADSFGDTDSLPIYERFFAGGANTIRGYRERRVGPRDPSSNDPIGGESMLVANVELSFPLVEYIRAAAFYDIGNIWSKARDIGSGNYKSGIGLGVRVKTPIGPIRLDYGFPLNEELGEEKKGRFHFTMSRLF